MTVKTWKKKLNIQFEPNFRISDLKKNHTCKKMHNTLQIFTIYGQENVIISVKFQNFERR